MAERFRAQGSIIETDFFEGAPGSVKFGVAITRHPDPAPERGLILPVEDEAALDLVRHTYRAAGIIDDSHEAEKELRQLDRRSEKFVVMERIGKTTANLFATAKLVHNTNESEFLPMEKEFPHLFDMLDPAVCVEISQLVSRHPDSSIQECGFLAILRAAYGYALSQRPDYLQGLEKSPELRQTEEAIAEYLLAAGSSPSRLKRQDVYNPFGQISTIVGITEAFVFEHASAFGIKTRDLGEPIFRQEARDTATELHPVAFDVEDIRAVHLAGTNEYFNLYLQNIERHLGIGWFGDGVIENLDF